ncbi:MAG TPA: biopolymer transporter ExbD [Myxococcaceae bacterium]|nr:biopolymer transporter ExbD [Myxococcaceae bacterium]
MAGHKKAKKFAVQNAGAPNSEINVTPLVDVVLVLLIIFMVVTPLLEKDIEVKVPDTQQVETQTEVPQDQLIVSINETGEFQINSEKMPNAEEYQAKLKKLLERKKKKDEKLVFFMPDEKANYGKLVMALDGAKLAGAEILGMMTEIPEGMKGQDGAAPGGEAAPTTP